MADIDVLTEARLFQSSDPELRRRLALVRPRLRPLAAGETIYEPGDSADCVYLLVAARDGQGGAEPLVQVRLAREASERAVRFVRVVRGDIFGETEFLSAGLDPRPGKRTTSARALTASRVCGIPWSDLRELLELDAVVRARFLRLASRRLMDAVWAQHSRGREDPDIVLADWLVELAADFGVAASNRVRFPRKLSQGDIAEELGVARETISRRLKEWERAGLVVSSVAGLEISDYARLVRIGGLQSGRDRAALSHAVADVAAKIDSGDLVNARNIAADMLRYFPSSPELLHLLALTAARSGDREDAIAVLRDAHLTPDGDLEALKWRVARALKNPFAAMERIAADEWIEDAFEDDEDGSGGIADTRLVERLTVDLAALEARLLKDRAFDAATPDAAVAAESGMAYEAIWRRMGSWYAGVNAASMALAAGNAKQAQKLAGEVLKRIPDGPNEYWAAATAAEALLVSGDKKQGLSMLSEAALKADASDANKASTALQLSRLAPQLGLGMDQVRAALSVKSVAVVTGHMFRAAEMDAARQKQAAETIRAEAEAVFRKHNVGHVFGALACGADLVMAEAALDAGIPFHAVVPLPLPRYVELSVAIGDPEGDAGHWERRFDEVLHRAASLTLIDDELPLDRDLDGHFYYGFRFMAGLALMRAEALQAECRLIAVIDGTAAANVAGSNQAAADWLAAGRPLDTIAFNFKRKAPAGRPRGASSFRPVVFLWDATGGRADSQVLKKAGVARKKDFTIVERVSRVGGAGTAVVAPTLKDALALAESCAAPSGKDGVATLRVICDFGPVLGGDLKPDEKMIARLKAGSDMPGFPPGRVLATQSFAAQATAELGEHLAAYLVGRTAEGRDGEAARLRHRPGLPVYRVSLRPPK
jgi:CRP-like cAMP-binding protein